MAIRTLKPDSGNQLAIDLGSDADGDVYYRASGALARLPKGTASQVLQMNSGATAPEWAAANQIIHLETVTLGSGEGTAEFEGKLTSTYATYMLIGNKIKPTTDNIRLNLQFGIGSAGSVTWRNTEYYTQAQKIEAGSWASVINESNVSESVVGGFGNQGNATNEYGCFITYLFNTQESSVRSMGNISAANYKQNAEFIFTSGGFVNTQVEIHTSVKVFFSSSSTGQGRFSLYGIKEG
jgi:hypothetical protein